MVGFPKLGGYLLGVLLTREAYYLRGLYWGSLMFVNPPMDVYGLYLEVHGTYEPTIAVLISVLITIFGHLGGMFVNPTYSPQISR